MRATNRVLKEVYEGKISNREIVQHIELLCGFLNLKTIPNYARNEGISYNGAKKRKTQKVIIDNIKFIVDNE